MNDTTTLERAEAALTDSTLAHAVDTILRKTPTGYRAAGHRGSVDFQRDHVGAELTVTATSGENPLANQATDQRTTVAAETDGASHLLGDHATPLALSSVAQYFDSPQAPDLVLLYPPGHRFHGNVGEHGSLATTQARAPFVAAGKGIVGQGIIDDHIRTVDIAPTVLALLGAATIDGTDGLGNPRQGLRLMVQDGDEAAGLVDHDRLPRHVVLFLWDGTNAQALHDAVARGDAPNAAALMERGTSYRHGAYASLPTATLANHMTATTGVFPGRSGVLHNTWYDRSRRDVVDLLDFRQMITARDHLRADIETIHEALHRNEPHARTIATYEYADRGADWSSYQQMASRQPQAQLTQQDRRRHRTADYMDNVAFRNYSTYDAQSVADAKLAWSGNLGALPRFSWITLNLTDTCGHEVGPHAPMTQAAIRDSDARMGEIINLIDTAGVLDDTAIILCADHGMQHIAQSEALDMSGPLTEAGIQHTMVDAQYVYLTDLV